MVHEYKKVENRCSDAILSGTKRALGSAENETTRKSSVVADERTVVRHTGDEVVIKDSNDRGSGAKKTTGSRTKQPFVREAFNSKSDPCFARIFHNVWD